MKLKPIRPRRRRTAAVPEPHENPEAARQRAWVAAINLVPDASRAGHDAVAIVAADLKSGLIASPMPTPAGAVWLQLTAYGGFSQTQLKTLLEEGDERDRIYRSLRDDFGGRIAAYRDVAARSNHYDPSGHLVGGPPAEQLAAIERLAAAVDAMSPLTPPRGQRPDPARAEFGDFLCHLYLRNMHYGQPDTYWRDDGDYSGSLAELLHSAPNDWTSPPFGEDDLGEHYDDAGRLYDFLRDAVRDARRRHGLKAR